MTMLRQAGTTLLALVLSATAAGAQQTLHARMDAFLGSLMGEDRREPYEYFPRRGSWTWINTDDARVGVHRFPAGETRRALDGYCPLRDSFTFQPEGQPMGALIGRALEHGSGWRRVRGTRFVPPGAPATSPAFVEWRREDGRWVVSAFGDESPRGRTRVPDDAPNTVRRLTPGVAESTEEGPWYTGVGPIHFDGRRWFLNGPPRVIPRNQLKLLGLLGRVPVYVEAGIRDPDPLWVPLGPGLQVAPYQTNEYPRCK